jgi:hypothetical protein
MPTFSDLWANHPSSSISLEDEHNPANFPCTDKKGVVHPALENQCAIRLGIAFAGAGIKTESVPGQRCWNGHGRQHILRVLDLVPWIDKNTTKIGCKTKVVHKKVAYADFLSKKGIFYFQNFYGRNNQGDHIDLWNGSRLGKGYEYYFEKSEEVWFWEM